MAAVQPIVPKNGYIDARQPRGSNSQRYMEREEVMGATKRFIDSGSKGTDRVNGAIKA